MKMIASRTTVATALPFVVEDLQDHLRTDGGDDLAKYGHAARHDLEDFAQVALLRQTITVTILNPDQTEILRLPIGPSFADATPTVLVDGTAFTEFDFVAGIRPLIIWQDSFFSRSPHVVEIQYDAGFGTQASDIPSDLTQALLDQAALHFDGRSPMNARSLTTSPHMARVGARYRGLHV